MISTNPIYSGRFFSWWLVWSIRTIRISSWWLLTVQIFRGSEMRVSGSEFWICGASTSTSKQKGAMARYRWCRGPLRKLVRTGTYTAFYQLSSLRIKIPTHMRKQLQINLFSLFNLARNLKDQFSFSCSHWRAWVQLPVVNPHSLGFNLMCFRRCSIRMKLVILISHLFHRYQFINQFLRGINVHWVVIFQFVIM